MMLRRILLLLVWGTASASLANVPAFDQVEKLAYSQEWLKLLHYQKSGHSYQSRVDTPQFFFSSDGKVDPKNELLANIAAFNSLQRQVGTIEMPPACVFPARYALIREKLPGILHDVACKEFEDWRKSLDVEKVTMVFASAYANNPASMFGHTMLRLDHRRSSESNAQGLKLLDYAVSFLARVDADDDPLSYTFKGIFGGYMGVFNLDPYYTTVTIYASSEQRDLWEYPLPLLPSEVERLVQHLWELQLTGGFTYFFFDENCSFQILGLIEAAAPRLELIDGLRSVVLPHETIQALSNQSVLLPNPQRRPSLASVFSQQRSLLGREARSKLSVLIDPEQELPRDLSTEAVDGAITYFNIRNYQTKNQLPAAQKSRLRQLLMARAVMQDGPSGVNEGESDHANEYSPDRGHGTRAFRGYVSKHDDETLGGVRWKMGFHEFLNDSRGYETFGEINFIDVGVRRESESGAFSLDDSTVGEVVSIQPFDLFFPRFSWRTSLTYRSLREIGCVSCREISLLGGGGFGASALNGRVMGYALILAKNGASASHIDGFEAGPQAQVGAVFSGMNQKFKLHMEMTYDQDWTRRRSRQNFLQFDARGCINFIKNQDFRIEYEEITASEEFEPWREVRISYGFSY